MPQRLDRRQGGEGPTPRAPRRLGPPLVPNCSTSSTQDNLSALSRSAGSPSRRSPPPSALMPSAALISTRPAHAPHVVSFLTQEASRSNRDPKPSWHYATTE